MNTRKFWRTLGFGVKHRAYVMWWGACGQFECKQHRPYFDSHGDEIPGTRGPAHATGVEYYEHE